MLNPKKSVSRSAHFAFPATASVLVALATFAVIVSSYYIGVQGVFGAMLAITVIWLAVARVRDFALFLAFYVPLEGFLLKWLPPQIGSAARFLPEVVLMLAMAKLVTQIAMRQRRWYTTGLEIPMAGLVLISVVSCTLSGMPVLNGMLELRLILRYVLIVLLLVNIGIDNRFVRRFALIMVGAGLIQAGIGLMQAVWKDPVYNFFSPGTFRVFGTYTEATAQPFSTIFIRGTFTRYTNFGNFISLVILLLLALQVEIRKHYSKLTKWVVPILAIVSLLSVSRQALGALIVGCSVAAIAYRKAKSVLIITLPLLFLIFGVGYFAKAHLGIAPIDRYFEVFTSQFRYGYATFSTGSRWIVLRHVPTALWHRPLLMTLGTGPGGFRFDDVREELLEARLSLPGYLHVHDVYWIRLLVTFGVIGLSVWLFLLYRSALPSVKLLRKSDQALHKAISLAHLSMLAAICTMAFFGDYFETRETSVYLWVLAGITGALSRRLNSSENRDNRQNA